MSHGQSNAGRLYKQSGTGNRGASVNDATPRSGELVEQNRIFVTGATGFLGQHVAGHLLGEGRTLTLAVRDARRCPTTWQGHPDISILEIGELGPDTEFGDTLSNADAVVHLAGLAHIVAAEGQDTEARFMKANASATEALARAASRSGIRSFVHMSSLAAITPNAVADTIDDSSDLGPITAYGRSKRMAEQHVRKLVESSIFSVSLRPPLVVGAEARGNWAALQALAATGLPLPFASVRNRRSFIGVRTLCEAISLLCGKAWPTNLSGEYCIADTGVLSLPEVTRLLREGMGRPERLFAFPPSAIGLAGVLTGRRRETASMTGDLKVDPSRFYRSFDFRPSSSLRDAILRSGADYATRRRPAA